MDVALSRNGVPIRLTEERWFHIVENHDDLAGHYDDVLNTIEDPDFILRGTGGALIAAKGVARKTYIAVIYKEVNCKDGFVITAYFTSKLSRRSILWRKGQQR